MATRIKVPAIKDIEYALRVYYTKHELSSRDIQRIFGVCTSSAYTLKKAANEYSEQHYTPRYNASYANTEDAFAVWGIDIKRLEEGYKHLKKLGIGGDTDAAQAKD